MVAQESRMVNLYEETERMLHRHGVRYDNIRFIRNSYGYITVADFTIKAREIWYEPDSDKIEIDPSLKIIGATWRAERYNENGKEGWIYFKKPERPMVQAGKLKIFDSDGFVDKNKWIDKLEK